jgi:hypothetical protein
MPCMGGVEFFQNGVQFPIFSIFTSKLQIRTNVQETGLHQLMKSTTLGPS